MMEISKRLFFFVLVLGSALAEALPVDRVDAGGLVRLASEAEPELTE